MLVVDEVQAGLAGRVAAAARRHPGARERQAHRRLSSRWRKCSTTRSARRSTSRSSAAAKCSSATLRRAGPARDHARRDTCEFGDAVVHDAFLPDGAPLQCAACAACTSRIPGYVARRGGRAARRGDQQRRTAGRSRRSTISSRRSPRCRDGARAALRYSTLDDPQGQRDARDAHGPALVPGARLHARRAAGYWPCHELARAAACGNRPPGAHHRSPATATRWSIALAPSLVLVNFDMPFSVAGVTERNYHGTGRDRGRRARPGRRGPQHRAGRGRRRAPHVRRVGRGAGPGRVRASAAQPGDRVVRPAAARRHADPRRELRSRASSSPARP